MITEKLFGKSGGAPVYVYTLSSGGLSVDVCDLGARINAVRYRGTDVALGFRSPQDYEESGCYSGATVGRVAGRIAAGEFVLGGERFRLTLNDGKNHLHGGTVGFDKRRFAADVRDGALCMRYVSPDGEQGYPGELRTEVRFSVEDDCLRIDYFAVSDKDTLWGPTCHAYFNLDGEGCGDCLGNILQINASSYTPTGDGLIPSGEVSSVAGTALDFRSPKAIGRDRGAAELLKTNGYDHNFVLSGEHAARASSVKTGISLDLFTDLPCMQLYSGGAFRAARGMSRPYANHDGFALEPQYCPNAVNIPGFAAPLLKAGVPASHYIKYKFSRCGDKPLAADTSFSH